MTDPGPTPNESGGDELDRAAGHDGDDTASARVHHEVHTPDEAGTPEDAVAGDAVIPGDQVATRATVSSAARSTSGSAPRTVVVERAQNPGPLFWLTLGLGWGIIGFGIHGIVSNWAAANPPVVLRTVVGLNVLNDALVAPALVAVAFACRRLLPRWSLVAVQIGLIVTAVVVLYSYPLVGSWGKSTRSGTSRLPWNYAHNLEIVLVVIWMACALLAAWSWHQSRLRRT